MEPTSLDWSNFFEYAKQPISNSCQMSLGANIVKHSCVITHANLSLWISYFFCYLFNY